jgi:hypothetical protein
VDVSTFSQFGWQLYVCRDRGYIHGPGGGPILREFDGACGCCQSQQRGTVSACGVDVSTLQLAPKGRTKGAGHH